MLGWEKERAGAKGSQAGIGHCRVVEQQNSCATTADATPELFGTGHQHHSERLEEKLPMQKSILGQRANLILEVPVHAESSGMGFPWHPGSPSTHTCVTQESLLLPGASVQQHPAHQTPSPSMAETGPALQSSSACAGPSITPGRDAASPNFLFLYSLWFQIPTLFQANFLRPPEPLWTTTDALPPAEGSSAV